MNRYYKKIPVRAIRARYLPHRSIKSIMVKAENMGLTTGKTSATRLQAAHPELYDADDLGELWDTLLKFQDASRALSTRVDTAFHDISTTGPICVGFLADAHIGALTCRYDELIDRFNMMVDIPDFYLFSVGDSIDNYLPDIHEGTGMFGQLVPPELQKRLVEDLYAKMRGRWLGVVGGCHDEFSHKVDDFDWNKYLAEKLDCPNLGFGGTVTINVGGTLYSIMLRHKYRFNSTMNLTHTVKRMREMLGDFDVGVIAHNHQAAIEQVLIGDGIDRIFVRPGSFKGADRWSRSVGYSDTGAFIPSIILFPDKRKMIPFLHLEQAATVMRALTQ